MFHMIIDNIEAYRRAVRETARAQCMTDINPTSAHQQTYRDCYEEQVLRQDGLVSVIKMAIQEAAAAEPHNPFSINGDVNQDPVQPRSRLQQFMDDDPQVRNEHGTFPPPPSRKQ